MLQKQYLKVVFVLLCPLVASPANLNANDKIEQAIRIYEERMESERAKVLAVFEKENRLADRKNDVKQKRWIAAVKRDWINDELILSERGGIRFFSGATESFGIKDFRLSKFTINKDRLFSNDGKATILMNKPARSVYFKAMIESKNNFAIQFSQGNSVLEKDVAIIVGGWNNRKSEIHFDGEAIASKPVGMPPRWLCEVFYENQNVCVYANGIELMKARAPRPVAINMASISVSHDAETTVHSPVLKVK